MLLCARLHSGSWPLRDHLITIILYSKSGMKLLYLIGRKLIGPVIFLPCLHFLLVSGIFQCQLILVFLISWLFLIFISPFWCLFNSYALFVHVIPVPKGKRRSIAHGQSSMRKLHSAVDDERVGARWFCYFYFDHLDLENDKFFSLLRNLRLKIWRPIRKEILECFCDVRHCGSSSTYRKC